MNSEKNSAVTIEQVASALSRLTEIEDKKEDAANKHRIFNSLFMLFALALSVFAYFKVPEYQFESDFKAEVYQLVQDESLRLKAYNDTEGNKTIGFGHLVLDSENLDEINELEAIKLLKSDYSNARLSVEQRYEWAEGDVKLVLINMTYQMGPSRLSKFVNAISALKAGSYDLAAAELLNSVWAKQTPNRANRLAGRILQLDSSFW